MKAIVCEQYGPIDQVKIKEVPNPIPAGDEVVIEVAYAGINYPDTLIVQGLYQVKPPLPFTPGHECSGVVIAVGKDVTSWKVGDRVWASTGTNSFAEKIKIAHHRVRQLPTGVDFKTGCVLSVTYMTALNGIRNKANLQEGETILVLGASGGVGSAAIELAKAAGATVIAAASSQEKLDYCKSLGADYTINYESENLKDRVMEITNKNGVNVVFDPVGDKYADPAMRSLGYGGRYLVVGFAAGEIPNIPLNLALLMERKIIGVYNGSWAPRHPKEVGSFVNQLNILTKTGKLKPKITKVFKMDEIVEALRYSGSRGLVGKAVLEINPNLT